MNLKKCDLLITVMTLYDISNVYYYLNIFIFDFYIFVI